MKNKNKNQTITLPPRIKGIVKTNGSIRVPLQVKAQNGTLFTPVPNNIALSVVNPKW